MIGDTLKILLIDTLHPCFKTLVEEKNFVCVDGTTWTKEETIQNISEYTGIAIRSRFILDKEILSHAKNLKFIARAGAGMENIDVSYAKSRNIICINAPEGNRDAVGEHAVGMLLSLLNNLNKADKEVRNGIWLRKENRGIELMGKTIGIIGFGNTGSAFAKKLSGFDLKILAYDKYVAIDTVKFPFVLKSSIEKIFDEADVVSLHVPLTDETKWMVDDNFILHFRKNIFLINTSRGQVINTIDLIKHLKSGKVKGACLDVFEFEESSFEDMKPEVSESFNYLVNSDRVVLSPHIAGWTHESNEKIAKVLAEKIIELKSK